MTQRDEIILEIEEHLGEIVINPCSLDIVMLCGFTEDEYNYYYKFYSIKEGYYEECVLMGFIPLYEVIDSSDYARLKRRFDDIFKTFGIKIEFELPTPSDDIMEFSEEDVEEIMQSMNEPSEE